jgi:hypothetical protein
MFPHLLEEVGELTNKERRFVLVLEVVQIEKHVVKHHRRFRKRETLFQVVWLMW